MAAGNISLPEPLLAEIQTAAEAQHRTADELAADAIRQYLNERSWMQFVECAVAAGADCIVSGDNDLLRLGQYDGMPVMNPSDFLTLFQSRERER